MTAALNPLAPFGMPTPPQPQQMPASPMQDDRQRALREVAARDAALAAMSGGRESTISAGRAIALDRQAARMSARGRASLDLGLG
jgi:hypothetical protein